MYIMCGNLSINKQSINQTAILVDLIKLQAMLAFSKNKKYERQFYILVEISQTPDKKISMKVSKMLTNLIFCKSKFRKNKTLKIFCTFFNFIAFVNN